MLVSYNMSHPETQIHLRLRLGQVIATFNNYTDYGLVLVHLVVVSYTPLYSVCVSYIVSQWITCWHAHTSKHINQDTQYNDGGE